MSTSAGTTVVNVSPDTALNLSEFVCFLVEARRPEAGRPLFAECSAHISGAETELLLAKLIDQTEDVLQAEREADAEGCFQAMVPILFTLHDAEQQARLIRRIIFALTASDSSRVTLRLRVLVSVFNLMVSAEAKHELLTAILTYGLRSGQAAAVAKYCSRVDAWADAWGLSKEHRRAAFLAAIDVLRAVENQASETLRFQIKYLETFTGEDFPAEVLALASDVLLVGVSSPVSSYKDRNTLLQSFSKYASHPTLGPLVELLRILCEGSLDDYRKFAAGHSEMMASKGIAEKSTEHAMRLLCLCSLAESEPQLSYGRVAEVLQVPLEEVELWVVEAVANGLLEATVDQVPEVVTVSRCIHRSFGREQWLALQQRLAVWRRNVAGLVDTNDRHEAVSAV